MAQRELEELTPEQCLELLGTARVGRLVYLDDEGPVAVPVNYALAGSDIVFRVEGGIKQAAMAQPTLAFEVDHIADHDRSGWSVIARGTGRVIPMTEVPSVLKRIAGPPPQPWAEGIHNVWLALTPRSTTGRRLGDERSAAVF